MEIATPYTADKVKFGMLTYGTVFRWNHKTYMKIGGNFKADAVDLENGLVSEFNGADEVERLLKIRLVIQ